MLGNRFVSHYFSLLQIMQEDGFSGSIKEYNELLRNDSTNFYPDGESMLQGYKDIVSESHALVAEILHKVPGTKVE